MRYQGVSGGVSHCYCYILSIDAWVHLRFHFGIRSTEVRTEHMSDHPSNIRKACLKAYLTQPEKAEVLGLAKQAHLTTSELVRRLVLGRELPNIARHEAVIALAKTNGDLARLGNLFRMALADEDFALPQDMNLEMLLNEIRVTQTKVKTKVAAL